MNQTFDQIVGQILKNKRKQLNKSQEKVEEEASLSDRHLGKIEQGKVSPEFYTIFKLCNALDIHLGELEIAIKKEMDK